MRTGSNADQDKIAAYIQANPVIVVGTVDADETPHGAAVYGCLMAPDTLYFLTKTETKKFQNILDNPTMSLTIVNPAENSTLQATGTATAETDPQTMETVMGKLRKIQTQGADWLPPIAKLRAGPYQLVRVHLNHVRLANYLRAPIGDTHIFTEE